MDGPRSRIDTDGDVRRKWDVKGLPVPNLRCPSCPSPSQGRESLTDICRGFDGITTERKRSTNRRMRKTRFGFGLIDNAVPYFSLHFAPLSRKKEKR
ncbi:hypothetical protein CDAR_97441 [Caerostris darwini]|uniref:Uncharacterized protein n=1 Tax=Caerostris darwini TaxID=1538125 RepID=A0AAV4PV78_9ARAC|nr:hypothetical protein CDAR_97441 [Caerostris darwini]